MGDWLLTRNTYCKIVAVWLRVCTTLNQPKTISDLRINIVFSRGQSNTFFKNGLQKHKYPFPGFQLDKQNNSSRGVKKREGFGSGWVNQTHASLIFSLLQMYYGINCCFTPFYKLSAWNRLMHTRLTIQLNMCNLYSILFPQVTLYISNDKPKALWHQTHHQNILPDCVIKPEKNSLQLIETIFSPRSSANVLAEWESSWTRAGGSPQFDSKRDKNQKFGLEVYCAFTVNLNLETFSSCFLYQEKVRLQTGKGHPTIHVIQALEYVNSARTFLWEVPEKDRFCQHPNKGFLHLML